MLGGFSGAPRAWSCLERCAGLSGPVCWPAGYRLARNYELKERFLPARACCAPELSTVFKSTCWTALLSLRGVARHGRSEIPRSPVGDRGGAAGPPVGRGSSGPRRRAPGGAGAHLHLLHAGDGEAGRPLGADGVLRTLASPAAGLPVATPPPPLSTSLLLTVQACPSVPSTCCRCPHCRQFAPEYEKVAAYFALRGEAEPVVMVARIDCANYVGCRGGIDHAVRRRGAAG